MKKIKNLIDLVSFLYILTLARKDIQFFLKNPTMCEKAEISMSIILLGAIQISGEDILILKDITNF